VVEEPAVKGLIDLGMCVVMVGGGGIPVVADESENQAIITNPENIDRALRGDTGTHIVP
jgi:carbamate kinase